MGNFWGIKNMGKVSRFTYKIKLFIKGFLRKARNPVNFGLKNQNNCILDFLRKGYIMDKENYKQNSQSMKGNLKTGRNTDSEKSPLRKQV